jgi:hypothetical protein
MDSARLYRNRAAHLRELASTERDVSVRRQLKLAAIRFDQFAEELESRRERRARRASDGAYTGRASSAGRRARRSA